MICKALIESNKCKIIKKPKFNKKGIYCIDMSRYSIIGGKEISILVRKINEIICTYGRSCRHINLKFGNISFRDKLTYIMLECIIYALTVECDIKTGFYFIKIEWNVQTLGLEDSFLLKIDTINSDHEFEKNFNRMLSRKHFRRVFNGDTPDDSWDLCYLMSDIKSFFKIYNIDKSYINTLAMVITELIDNAMEHALSDCLIDIDVSEDLKLKDSTNAYCINIAVVDFSEICIGDKIKRKFELKSYDDTSKRYNMVEWAYMYHKERFSDEYDEEDFYNIVAFQDCISGRAYETDTGGTGLTELIKILEQSAEDHFCYMLSGNKGLDFRLNCLGYNEDGWIGFNHTKNFIGDVPDQGVVLRTNTFIPGTVYNFTLIVRKEQ